MPPYIQRSPRPGEAAILGRLRKPGPMVTIELRPPRSGLSFADSMDVWIDMYHALQRLARDDRFLFLTDNAVGAEEEESLSHLAANLATDVEPSRIIPFLTCKHELEYCLMFAKRAASRGFDALTVLGGDHTAGPSRCVPHAYELRRIIRERVPALTLGGWANPHRDPDEQVGFLARDDFTADFYLTQIVSHHSLDRVEAFLGAVADAEIDAPGVFGVFYYRSANPRTLATLGRFFPVPAEEITREFASGASAEEICARSIVRLREAGAEKIYLSNLGFRDVERRFRSIMAAVDELEA